MSTVVYTQAQIAQLEADKADLQLRCAALHTHNEQLDARIVELEHALATANATAAMQSDTIDDYMHLIHRQTTIIQSTYASMEHLERSLEYIRRCNDRQTAAHATTTAQLEEYGLLAKRLTAESSAVVVEKAVDEIKQSVVALVAPAETTLF
jgi:chromosome segregation ATPase